MTAADARLPPATEGLAMRRPPPARLWPVLQSTKLLYRFRVLEGSGKTTLVDTVFGINTVAESPKIHDRAVERGVTYPSNPCLILHQYTLSDSEDQKDLHDFLKSRTNPKAPLDERLNLIWICMTPNDDATGLPEIVDICRGNVAIVLVFNKIDEIVFKIIMDVSFEDLNDYLDYDWRLRRAKEKCRMQVDHLRRSIVRDSQEVLTAYTSMREGLADTVDELVARTEEALMTWMKTQSPVIYPISLWVMAQRHSKYIKLDSSAYVGKSRYWSKLSTDAFIGNRLQTLFEVIHADIVTVWNVVDPFNILDSKAFETTLLHIVNSIIGRKASLDHSNDLVTYINRRVDRPPKWIQEGYLAKSTRQSITQVSRLMTYIVALTIILNDFFERRAKVTETDLEVVIEDCFEIEARTEIREAIASFTIPTDMSTDGGNRVAAELRRLTFKFCGVSDEK
ncbi:hypothetical protein K474DRAFT_1711975 [Panus rudis PR-1116 ss-1]|nr:hypothetical protein K474DRAFT_1711975 [Panus rudis PR-1116 ss-1]